MPGRRVLGRGQKVAVRHVVQKAGHLRLGRRGGQRGANPVLPTLQPRGPFFLFRRAALEAFQRVEIQFAQQPGLPTVPDLRADGLHVREGQQVQAFQAVRVFHDAGEVRDLGVVRQVAALGDVRHRQVVLDEELPLVGVVRRQLPAAGRGVHQFGAARGMLDSEPLAHVVIQQSQKQQVDAVDLAHDLRRQRQRVLVCAVAQAFEFGHAVQGVLVDGVHVVQVALGAPAQVAELGQQPLQHAGFVHGPQGGRDALLPRQDRQHRVAHVRSGGRVRRQAGRGVAHGALRFSGHRDVVPLGVVEHGDEVARVADEDAGVGHVQGAVDDADAVADVAAARALPEIDEPRRRDAALEHPRGELVHRGDVPVVAAHEVGRVREPERGGKPVLVLETQHVPFGAVHQVQPVADPPQEIAGRLHVGQAGLRHDALHDQVAQVGELELDFGQPPGRMQVTQPAAAVLDVGLQQVQRVAVPVVAGAAFPCLGLEERGAALADHVAGDRGAELLGQ